MTWRELLSYMGTEPEEAAKLASADRELGADEMHLIRMFLEAVMLGMQIERRHWEKAERQAKSAAQSSQPAAQSTPAGGAEHRRLSRRAGAEKG